MTLKVLLYSDSVYIMTTQLIELHVSSKRMATRTVGCLGLLARRISFESIALSLDLSH